MQKDSYSFSEFGFSSQIIQDLVSKNSKVNPFVDYFFSDKNIENQFNKKNFNCDDRLKLHNSLVKQNKSITLNLKSKTNIDLLKNDNTYTITTGHQLNFLTGPLYAIYKIIQIINWTEKLNKTYPHQHFVPIFWMATEDHDFEEINHIHLFNSKIEIEAENQQNYIAGEIVPSNFESVKLEILEKFSDETLKTKIEQFINYYKNNNLAQATRGLLNELFGKYGLVIIDGNDHALKKSFLPIIKQEIKHQVTFNSVSKTNIELENSGYHNQVFLRECNLFYIENEKVRHRIIKTEKGFEINHQDFTANQLIEEAEKHPERFSPNALMRPLYQETILPNLVYFGGGGEIAYWLQLNNLFKTLNLTYPLLRVRDSYILLNQKDFDLLNKFKYSVLDLKQNIDDLLKIFVKNNATSDIQMNDEIEFFNKMKQSLTSKVEKKDIGLQRFIEGELVRIENTLDKIEKKLIQNEKKHQEKTLKQIQKLRDKIYPKNGFQERYENFLQYAYQPDFINNLKKEAEQYLTEQPQIKVVEV